MASQINEFRYPDKAVDYNKLENADDFWGWNTKDAAEASGLEDLTTVSGKSLKSVSNVILWLNKAAYAWKNKMYESGDSKMKVEDFRKIVREELDKVYKKKITKDAPAPKLERTEEKREKDKELNTQAEEQMKRDGSSKPTDAEWKKMRTAQLETPVPTFEEQKIYENEMMEYLKKDLPKIAEQCKKLGDKELNGLVKDALYTYAEMHLGRKRVRYYEMKNSLAAIGRRLISLGVFKKSNDEKDDKKINKDMDATKELIKKYLKKQEMKAPKEEKSEDKK